MSSSAPTSDSSGKITEHAQSSHKGHRLTHVGSVSVDQAKGGGTFDVWYCQNDHALLTDIRS